LSRRTSSSNEVDDRTAPAELSSTTLCVHTLRTPTLLPLRLRAHGTANEDHTRVSTRLQTRACTHTRSPTAVLAQSHVCTTILFLGMGGFHVTDMQLLLLACTASPGNPDVVYAASCTTSTAVLQLVCLIASCIWSLCYVLSRCVVLLQARCKCLC
jgi:hypothetical protein